MSNSKKLRVAVLYGGRSGEHEISLRSAASVIRHLDPSRFDVIPVAIDKQGRWLLNDLSLIQNSGDVLPVFKDAPKVLLPPNPENSQASLVVLGGSKSPQSVDVIFPVMHGPLCEDGSIQGIFELADVAYVGCGVLSSSVGMDKDMAKRVVKEGGLPIVPYLAVKSGRWKKEKPGVLQEVKKSFDLPVFVKPANLGSSVGVYKVKEWKDLEVALENAFRFDTKVLVEKGVPAREIELAVLENPIEGAEPLVSVAGEIVPGHEFYSYEAKYLDENGAELLLPAKLEPAQMEKAKAIAKKAFELLECEGMARVDLFLDKISGEFYFNEINTIPGFTSISMYPKMWEYSGIPYPELLTRLIDLAVARHERRKKLVRDYNET
ncbi:MAG: D-alanine--D-alanine ligase [Bdellovibrio sp.]|nr:D-alanine--D-alanine ligase [Bdellovibrio sp.]